MNQQLNSKEPLSELVKKQGITHWDNLVNHVRKIPYGRNSDRTDFSLVIKENLGTCSSKHAFLKAVAEENKLENVKLILCLYKMSEQNTPGIGNELSQHKIEFIPEAHCYLMVGEESMDVTNEESDLTKIENDIIEEIEISAEQVGAFKVKFHKNYLKNWISQNELNFSFDEIWKIREKCIANLS